MIDNNPTVNAKLLKELQRWASADKARDKLRRVWLSGGWLYASDSFRAVRAKAPEGAPDGVAIDREVVERMTPRDLCVELLPSGARLGRAVFPYVPMGGAAGHLRRVREGGGAGSALHRPRVPKGRRGDGQGGGRAAGDRVPKEVARPRVRPVRRGGGGRDAQGAEGGALWRVATR